MSLVGMKQGGSLDPAGRGLIVAHTDGACHRNPGPGGWGVVFELPSGVLEVVGGEPLSTNNQMEMQAVLQALTYANQNFPGVALKVRSDSQYVIHGITQWRRGWEKRGWKASSGKPVKNADLWREIFAQVDASGPDLGFEWVRGHNGDPGNERADLLALEGLERTQAASRNGSEGPFRWIRLPGEVHTPFGASPSGS